jgi:threonine aldolase
VSKHRFIAAQFEAFFAADLWLGLARHANQKADRLAALLSAAGLPPVWPVEANEVFVILPRAVDARLKTAGANYYPWNSHSLPEGAATGGDAVLVRLVTSFATTDEDVAQFIAVATGR